MRAKTRRTRTVQVPESVDEWLDKWQPRIPSLANRRGRAVAGRATNALDELEFLLYRTVGNQVSE